MHLDGILRRQDAPLQAVHLAEILRLHARTIRIRMARSGAAR